MDLNLALGAHTNVNMFTLSDNLKDNQYVRTVVDSHFMYGLYAVPWEIQK